MNGENITKNSNSNQPDNLFGDSNGPSNPFGNNNNTPSDPYRNNDHPINPFDKNGPSILFDNNSNGPTIHLKIIVIAHHIRKYENKRNVYNKSNGLLQKIINIKSI